MRLEHKYWIQRGFLDSDMCDAIVAQGNKEIQKRLDKGEDVTGLTQAGKTLDIRNNQIAWLDEPYLYKLFSDLVTDVNRRAGWNWSWTHMQPPQFSRYLKKHKFEWHGDGASCSLGAYTPETQPNQPYIWGKVRKITVAILLNDDFKGGEFQTRDWTNTSQEITTINLNKGDALVFPGFMQHRVKKIIGDNPRYSLVCWFVGNPWA